jgi:hypothetical protein
MGVCYICLPKLRPTTPRTHGCTAPWRRTSKYSCPTSNIDIVVQSRFRRNLEKTYCTNSNVISWDRNICGAATDKGWIGQADDWTEVQQYGKTKKKKKKKREVKLVTRIPEIGRNFAGVGRSSHGQANSFQNGSGAWDHNQRLNHG